MPLTPGGYAPYSPRRGHKRRNIMIIGVVVLLLVVAGAGGLLLKQRRDSRTQDRRAVRAAQDYLAAWTALDRSGADATAGGTPATVKSAETAAGAQVTAATVAGTATVAAVVTAMTTTRDNLRVTAASYVPGTLSRQSATATVPYTASLTLSGLAGAFTYSSTLHLVKQGGGWKVSARLDSVHPALAPDLRLTRTASTAQRGKLLDATGNPLSDDSELSGNLVGAVSPPTGLERVYDSELSPSGGAVVVKNARNATVQTLRTYPMVDGKDLRTTLDLSVQRAGEAALASVTQPNAALVAIDTRTGGVLALVNRPLNGFGRAVRGTYPPGSTFKMVTATAALMSGKTATTPLSCTPTVVVDGRTFQNAEAEQFGTIPLLTAFAKSCNTAFINLETSLPAGALQAAAKLYGFDGSQPLPISSSGGSFPVPSGATESAADAIGQGRVLASPLQMASVAAAIASGSWRQPFVAGTAKVTHPLPAGVAPVLRTFMREVVTSGTAAGVSFTGTVYGKTGTAEYGTDNPPKTHAWFAGFRGTVAFAVIVEDGGFGATTAAPVAARFLTALGTS